MFLRTQAQFWMLAVLVGMFQGGTGAVPVLLCPAHSLQPVG